MGIVEHYFRVQLVPKPRMVNWKIYDVGGSRGQRASWVPFFEDGTSRVRTPAPVYPLTLPLSKGNHLPGTDLCFRPIP